MRLATNGGGMSVFFSRKALMALLCVGLTAFAAESAGPPVVLAVDGAAELAVIEVAGGAPAVVGVDESDPSGTWRLVSVTPDSAQFHRNERVRYQPHSVRVFLKAAERAPVSVQDQIEIPAVPRLILTPVESLNTKVPDPSQAESESQEPPQ